MRLIEREELKQKLDQGGDFKLVMVLGEWAFRAKRIPRSVHFENLETALPELGKDEDIVVYCAGPLCPASPYAYRLLIANGYTNVSRYAGGLADWEAAGYPLEGELVE